jgi:NADH-quinone oxidoreductase subunit N
MTASAQVPNLLPVLPEIVLFVGAMILLMFGAWRGERASVAVYAGGIMLLMAAAAIVVWLPAGRIVTFDGSLVLDDFARFLKVLSFGGSAVALLMSLDYFRREKILKFEYPVLVLLAAAGMGVLVMLRNGLGW